MDNKRINNTLDRREQVSVLTIASSDSCGGAGIQADLKAFAALGVHGCSVITCITAQNTESVHAIYPLPLQAIEEQLDTVVGDLQPRCAKTGMLYRAEIVSCVARKVDQYDLRVVVDPVMIATAGSSLIDDAQAKEFVDALRGELIPKAMVVMPNLYEATEIVGWEVKTIDDMKKACRQIHRLGCEYVLLKGGHLVHEEQAIDILYNGDFRLYTSPRQEREVHGSGCTFSAFLTALIALEVPVEEAVSRAKKHIDECIKYAYSPGRGVAVAHPFGSSQRAAERIEVEREVKDVLNELKQVLPSVLIPEVGTNLGYALQRASSAEDICAIDGRLVRTLDGVQCAGSARFGASEHIAKVILAAMKFDTNKRCAMNIKYSEKLIEICRQLDFKAGSFDRAEEPEGVSTLEWGTRYVIEKLSFVPDIIYDKGGIGKEPMVRILGDNPADVIDKLKKIIDLFTLTQNS